MTCNWRWFARASLVFGLAVPLLVGASQQVAAQEQATQEQEEEQAKQSEEEEGLVRRAEEVTVTGSLIPRKDLEALSPVMVLDAEEITYQGTPRIEDLITALPQAFNAQNSTIANGATGTATVALRHLGAVRTLVLINGRRMPAGDALSQTLGAGADLNFIPAALVKRVDVLTGGASSVYGADAVAGVVNFVLDTDFEGIKGGIRFSGFQHNNNNSVAQEINAARGFDVPSGSIFDGESFAANLAVGGKFGEGKGHASAYVDFRNIPAITKSERDYFNCSVNRGSSGPTCGGSSTTPQGRFISFTPDFGANGDFVLDLSTGNTFKPREGEVFNFGPFNHIQRPDKRYTGGGFVQYTVNPHFEAYAEVMFMDDNTDAQIAPTGNFGRTTTINCDNPMLSAQQRDLICTQAGFGPTDFANVTMLRRNIEGGARTALLRHIDWRLLAGGRGNFNDNWSYDVYGLHAQVSSPQGYINDLHEDRIGDALDVIGDPNDPSTWQCRSGNPGCVPWNVFQTGGVTQAAIDYMSVNAVLDSGTDTQMVSATFTGDLESYGLAFPSASEGIQIAVGAQYRNEHLFVNPDEVFELGLRAGSGGETVPVDGSFNVKELFVEALIPVVQDTPGAQDLSLELGYRYSDYSLAGGNSSYKAQMAWAPTKSLKLRTGFNRAVRAPNVRELFRPQGFGLGGDEDICANDPATGVPTASLEQCQRTGMSAAQYGTVLANPAQQYNTLSGGNPDLDVESADTLTVGIVWTPQAIAGLTATIDYYDIKVEDTIGFLDADDIIQTCANTGDPLLCDLIHRDRAGTLWLTEEAFTETTNQNIGELRGRGVDLNVAYPLNLGGSGFINFAFIGTYLLENNFKNPLTEFDCAGFYGAQCGQPDAKWRHRARATWNTNFNTKISLGWRRIGSTQVDDASPDPDLGSPGLVESWEINGAAVLKTYNYLDLAATYSFRDGVRLMFGVNNVLDEDPPLSPSLSSTGWTGTYDPLGRSVYTSLQFEF